MLEVRSSEVVKQPRTGIFQRSYALLSEFILIDGFQLFLIALPILLACFGLATKSRFPFTVATHLSTAYAGLLVRSWRIGVPTVKQASLVPIAIPSDAGLYVMATILGACLVSFSVTHCFLREEMSAARQLLPAWRSRPAGHAFVEHYNHIRYHESIENVTPADIYFGRAQTILAERRRIKLATIANRRL